MFKQGVVAQIALVGRVAHRCRHGHDAIKTCQPVGSTANHALLDVIVSAKRQHDIDLLLMGQHRLTEKHIAAACRLRITDHRDRCLHRTLHLRSHRAFNAGWKACGRTSRRIDHVPRKGDHPRPWNFSQCKHGIRQHTGKQLQLAAHAGDVAEASAGAAIGVAVVHAGCLNLA